ncbi:hypothetical protein CVIRNUC_008110 [Coccomyxa viridis]|uniref:Uncharacterized protein n=1 Tax=Coccomyxa viridis TaxID=1274662 RepID=A0AAV1IF81_9CHLO|nr:hypothetical protein CVIRNUC_008110 [Coccomyxa viridis]
MTDHAGVYNALIRRSQASDQPTAPTPQQRHPSLAVVHPHASCVINCPIDDAWAATRVWASFAWLPSVDGREVCGTLLDGGDETSVGAVRSLQIGDQTLFERLVALDDEEHTLKWKLISHPDTTNPFVASFVNYRCTCRLYPITVGSQTFFDWKGEFYTDPEHVAGMQATWERWYITAFQSLQNYVTEKREGLRRMGSQVSGRWASSAQLQQRPSQQQQQQQQQSFVPTSHGMAYPSRGMQSAQGMPGDVDMLGQHFHNARPPTTHNSSEAAEAHSDLQKVDSSSLSLLVSPKSSSIGAGSADRNLPSGGSGY